MTLLPAFLRRFGAALPLAALLFAAAPAATQAQPAAAPGPSNVLREITDVVGLKPRFELRATTEVENAAAVMYNGQRYLFYNPEFLAAVNRAGRTNWAGISILAHEMGHHLNGHTLRGGGSQPADELEADEFSGFVLRKMGASLAQSQAALAAVATDEGSPTHPGRTPRLAAIGAGWQRAEGQLVASVRQPHPSAAPVALSRPARQPAETSAPIGASAPRRPVASAASTPVQVVGQLTFRDQPDQPYYLTSNLSVVRLDEDSEEPRAAEVVGRVRRTSSPDFPFVLEDRQQRHLFITARGDVYNQAGQRVAKMI
ncbi:membrane-binding protein [uncultured Hymenobacter sp.]|uniref:membrane-binding protein n=1 Tax=uncultured Hymenobacter sp. TaxID=170016 RepID=UPI0035CADB09